MSLAKVVTELAPLKASYATGRVLRLPVNITVSVSYRCNSRCKTCNVWLLPNDDLTVPEWDRVFESLGRSPYWFTFSGGEPKRWKSRFDGSSTVNPSAARDQAP